MKTFTEDLNMAVITTKFVLEKDTPILHIFHYEDDGSWQFSGNESNLNDEDFRVVSLEEIIALDSSVLEVADLPLGGEAQREDIGNSWEIR